VIGPAILHVILVVAVEEHGTGIIDQKVDLSARVPRHAQRAFINPAIDLSPIFATSKVCRWVWTVAHNQPVALPFAEGK
jgi:hypothetical protein